MRDQDGVGETVGVSCDFEDVVAWGDDEEAGGHVEEDGHVCEGSLFGGREGQVAEDLAGGVGASA